MILAQLPSATGDESISFPTAGMVATESPTIGPGTTCGQLFSWFQDNPRHPAVPVVDQDGKVLALVNRLVFLVRYARQYAPELYSKKSVLKLANTDPLLVDEHTSITDLGASVLLDHRDALTDCFVVTSQGRYLGLGTAETLMRCKMQLLESRDTELRKALQDAREANKAKSSFLAMMSHELRTPLNAILGFSEIIHDESFGLDSPRCREYAGDINGAGKHLLALINDILDLSKAESGKLELNREAVDIPNLLHECARLMREKAMENDLRITSTMDPLPLQFVDRLRVKQIFLNLLSNAIKFTPNGGSISLTAGQDKTGRATIFIRDTGIGIAEEMIPAVFEPFRQVDTTLSRKFEGTGLGLSLVRSLMWIHGGSVTMESALGQGTAVTLVFPSSCACGNLADASAFD